MWPDRVSNQGPLALESDALPAESTRHGSSRQSYNQLKEIVTYLLGQCETDVFPCHIHISESDDFREIIRKNEGKVQQS